jgi:hypothetical protein
MEKLVRQNVASVEGAMDERARRLWAGTEAGAMGYGGVAAVARATGMAISSVRARGATRHVPAHDPKTL